MALFGLDGFTIKLCFLNISIKVKTVPPPVWFDLPKLLSVSQAVSVHTAVTEQSGVPGNTWVLTLLCKIRLLCFSFGFKWHSGLNTRGCNFSLSSSVFNFLSKQGLPGSECEKLAFQVINKVV